MAVGETNEPGLLRELHDGVLRLTIDRPEKRNALTDSIVAALIEELVDAGIDESVRVIVLRGNGEHFCSGFDIVARNSTEGGRPRVGSIQRRLPSQANRLVALMRRTQVPIVCEVRGWAAGIGLALALASDFTIADDEARFWAPFIGRGFTPDSAVTWMLPRRVGEIRAREMLLLGRVLTGREAAECSMIHDSATSDELSVRVEELVSTLASGPTVALGLTKHLLDSSETSSMEVQMQSEAFSLELSSRSEDFKEGLSAFREKREPRFRGR